MIEASGVTDCAIELESMVEDVGEVVNKGVCRRSRLRASKKPTGFPGKSRPEWTLDLVPKIKNPWFGRYGEKASKVKVPKY